MKSYSDFGRRLAKRREELGLSRAYVAKRVPGMTREGVTSLEAGGRDASDLGSNQRRVLARVMKWSEGVLVYGQESMPPLADQTLALRSPKGQSQGEFNFDANVGLGPDDCPDCGRRVSGCRCDGCGRSPGV
jgi:hypothetical protein